MSSPELVIRPPTADEGLAIHGLIAACPPLDVNSVYAYHLIARHHAATSVVAAGSDGRLYGCVTGYRLPEHPDTLFIWQVAVHADARGQGLASRMLTAAWEANRPAVDRMHTTIGPGNIASRTLFERFADRQGLAWAYQPWLSAEQCGGGDHEPEDLLVITPTPPSSPSHTTQE